ncbi:MAG TPA: phosphatidate cytidylyltransferase [Coriobacteriia bacterium]
MTEESGATGAPRHTGTNPTGRPVRDLGIRTASALVLGGVQIGALVWGGTLWWALVVACIGVLCTTEFYAITRSEHRKPNELFGLIAVAAMPLATAWYMTDLRFERDWFTKAQHGVLGLTGVLAMLVIAALVWHLVFRQVTTSDTSATVFGAVYVGFTLTHLVLMRELDSGTEFVLATLISVWVNDTFAYAIGSPFGHHKLAPTVSPKKSWEGLVAGTVGTIAVWVALPAFAQTALPAWWLGLTGLAVAVAAVLGDLAESRLKREVGVKDSGRLLPGHGGFLDRFDSMIMVSVVAFYMLLVGLQLFGGVR